MDNEQKSGFIIVNKPLDMTSHDVVYKLRKKLNTKKIGHTGTLDPKASGVLVCAINQGLKFIEYITDDTRKEYIATIYLGASSNTYDSEGVISKNENYHKPDIEIINNKINDSFIGKIKQRPPIHSRVKVNGVRAYDYARKNKELELPEREVIIYKNEVLEYKPPILKLRLLVSKGFYVRSLAHDLGVSLNTGAYLYALERTKVGDFDIKNAKKIDELNIEDIIPIEKSIDKLFIKRELSEEEYLLIINGKKIVNKDKSDKNIVGFFDNKIIAILKRVDDNKFLKVHKAIIDFNKLVKK